VADFLLEELSKPSQSLDWIAVLASIADELDVADEDWRASVSEHLMKTIERIAKDEALMKRDNTIPPLTIAFSSFGMLAPNHLAVRLEPWVAFHDRDISQMALFAVKTIFTGEQADDPEKFQDLRDAVYKTASQEQNEQGQNRTSKEMAHFSCAVQAMAVLGDARLLQVLRLIAKHAPIWEAEYLVSRLRPLKSDFEQQKAKDKVELLTACLGVLENRQTVGRGA
jgi:hypothetical protein